MFYTVKKKHPQSCKFAQGGKQKTANYTMRSLAVNEKGALSPFLDGKLNRTFSFAGKKQTKNKLHK